MFYAISCQDDVTGCGEEVSCIHNIRHRAIDQPVQAVCTNKPSTYNPGSQHQLFVMLDFRFSRWRVLF
jgi:hypothetical protein